jgi:TRAP-type C4-dicarboxylate transport system substrate-binding protein
VIPLLALLAAPAALLAADPAVTLRFAIADEEGRPSDPYVRAFAEELAARSGGTLAVDIVWDAGSATDLGFEQGVAQLLVDGQADLGLTAGRAWSAVGISALQALQAPFLIDSDELAEAVATDPLMEPLLAAMGEQGVAGLAVWPEDLRHPVAFEPCIAPITSPSDLQGRTVRAIASDVTFEMIEALGGTPIFVDGYAGMVDSCEIQAAESGLRQGASLPGRPTFTGDVTFFPKYQVLAANAAAFDKLSSAQQTAVREAAEAVRDQAIAEHPTEADAAAAWCANGGAVVLTGSEALAAWEAAAAPVVEDLAQDPATAAAIEAIEALKATTPRSPTVEACGPAPVASTAPSDLTGFSAACPPDGTYRIAPTVGDLVNAGASEWYAASNAQTWTLTITGDTWTGEGRTGSRTATCAGTSTPVEGAIRMSTVQDGGCGFDYDIVWREAENGIELRVLAVFGDPDYPDIVSERALNERVWVRIDG